MLTQSKGLFQHEMETSADLVCHRLTYSTSFIKLDTLKDNRNKFKPNLLPRTDSPESVEKIDSDGICIHLFPELLIMFNSYIKHVATVLFYKYKIKAPLTINLQPIRCDVCSDAIH